MSINPKVSSFFTKGHLKRSESGKKILTYEKSKSATNLFKFISFHPSIRASFNAMVKADFISLEKALSYLTNLLEQTKTSLVYEAKCSCGNILEKPHIYTLSDFKFPKSISCPKCKQLNNLKFDDYNPCSQIDLKDLLKALYKGDSDVFSISPIKECFVCGHQSIENSSKKLSLKCSKCSKLSYVSMQVFVSYEELNELLKEKQGYWLEWYLWKILKEKFDSEVGIMVNKKYEADLIINNNKKKIFVECKDTADSPLMNLHDIKKDFDYYILVSTFNYKKAHLDNAKKTLKKKFHHITSDKIEWICKFIEDLK